MTDSFKNIDVSGGMSQGDREGILAESIRCSVVLTTLESEASSAQREGPSEAAKKRGRLSLSRRETSVSPAQGRSRSPIRSLSGSRDQEDGEGNLSRKGGSVSEDEAVKIRRRRVTRAHPFVENGSDSDTERIDSDLDHEPEDRAKKRPLKASKPKPAPRITAIEKTTLEELKEAAKGKPGHPPTTGLQCGARAARAEALALRARELDLRMEEEVAQRVFNAARAFPYRGEGTVAGLSVEDLASSADEAACAVEDVATKSKNLKGGFVAHLKTSAQIVRATVDELVHRVHAAGAEGERDPVPSSVEFSRALEKMARLEKENRRLREKIKALEKVAFSRPSPLSPTRDLHLEIEAPRVREAKWTPLLMEVEELQRPRTPTVAPTPVTRRPDNGDRKMSPSLPPSSAQRRLEAMRDLPDEAPILEPSKEGTKTPTNSVDGSSLLQQVAALIDAKFQSFREEIAAKSNSVIPHNKRREAIKKDMAGGANSPNQSKNIRPESIGRERESGNKATPSPSPAPSRSRKIKGRERTESVGGGGRSRKAPPTPSPAPSVQKEGKGKSTLLRALAPSQESQEGTWATVVRKGGKKKNREAPPSGPKPKPQRGASNQSLPPPVKGSGQRKGNGSKKPAGAVPPNKRRAPRTAAVTLSCPVGESAEILAEARRKVDFSTLDIPGGMRVKRTQTGATAWEISGEKKIEKANALADQLRRVFAGRDEIVVSRPVKTAEARLSNMDDSVTSAEIAEAVAAGGKCSPNDVKVGVITEAPNKLKSAWLRCPIIVAKQIATVGHLKIGWTRAKFTLLEARTLQCYRCLEVGHVRVNCSSDIDRSGLCYRCGGRDHKAQACREAVRCPVCAAAGKPAGHRVGSKACPPPNKGKKRGGQNMGGPAPKGPSLREKEVKEAPRHREEEPPVTMEVQEGTSKTRGEKRAREREDDSSSPSSPERRKKATEDIWDRDTY